MLINFSTPSVLAINFAGIRHSPASNVVLRTVFAAFPRCRAFRDAMGESEEPIEGEVRNLVCSTLPT